MGSVKTPFITVITTNGVNIGNYCNSFTYEDCTGIDDIVRLKLENVPEVIVNRSLVVGVTCNIQFGYIQGAASKKLIFEISSVEPSFTDLQTVTVLLTSKSYLLKKDAKTTNFEGKSYFEIIESIAKANGLQAVITGLQRNLKGKENQASQTDFDYLQDLILRIPNGPYQFYVKNDNLIFSKRSTGKKPVKPLFYGSNGQIASFNPKLNNNLKSGANLQLTSTGVDPKTGKAVTTKANADTDGSSKQGQGAILSNANGKIVGKVAGTIKQALGSVVQGNGQNVNLPIDGNQETELQNRKAAKAEFEVTASIGLNEGNPYIVADENYTIAGVGQVYGGNWLATKVTHSISYAGVYSTNLELGRNSLNKAVGISNNSKAVTNAQGAKADETDKKKVRVFNANGKRVK